MGSKVALLLLLAAGPLWADDWPHWRGPARNGISAEKGWLDAWPADGPRVLWKAEVGTGFSSFAVAKGRVFTMGNADNTDTLFCFDAETGKTVWSHKYACDLGDTANYEAGPGATPTVDGDRVFTLSRSGHVNCLETAGGKVVWSENVQQDAGLPIPAWNFAGSPLVLGDLVLLNLGEAGVALERATGRLVWKSAAKEPGYSTPLPFKQGDQGLVLVSSGKAYHAVNPKTGQEAWRVAWVTSYGVNASDPIVDGGHLFVSTGYGKGAALFALGKGEPEVLWESRAMRNQMNSSVLLDGHVYGIDGNSDSRIFLKCLKLSTGEEKWAQSGVGAGSLMAADGKLIVLSAKGELLVAPAGPDGFKPTARASILDGKCWTVPVLANGLLYARNAAGTVVCLDLRKGGK